MFTNLFSILENEQVKAALNEAMQNKQALTLNSQNTKVNIIPGENGYSIQIESVNPAKSESAQFKDYLNRLPDDVFQGVCEMIGNDKVKSISTLLESDNIEQVRSGIVAFKNAVREYLVNGISRYKELLNM